MATAYNHTSFTEAYKKLNDQQRRAVDTIDGPVMVIAGPGTGKTQVLTLRIANILRSTDTAPESILAITFTNSGAIAMRERLRSYVGQQAYSVALYTFHGFAERLIRQYPEAYERIVGSSLISEYEQIQLLERIVLEADLSLLRPLKKPTHHIGAIRQEIGTLKQEYIEPDRLAELISEQEQQLTTIPQFHESGPHRGKITTTYSALEKQIEKQRELLHVYRLYQASLREQGRYDYADMIIETVHALERNEDMLRDLQETYQYVLADEHQDVNESQNRILELIMSYHDRPNLFVVGDEKQAIYRFQGASLENFLHFTDRFPTTTTITLTDNYRSGQSVLDRAHEVISVDDPALMELRVPLSAKAVSQSTVSLQSFSHPALEQHWLTTEVGRLYAAGTPASEVAVIVRTNDEVEAVAHELRRAQIPVAASAERDIHTHPIMSMTRALLEVVGSPEHESALVTVLHGAYWQVRVDDLVRVLTARSRRQPLAQLIRDEQSLQALDIADPESLLRVGRILDSLRHDCDMLAPHYAFERILNETGLLAYAHKYDPLESGRIIRRLYDEVQALVHSGDIKTVADIKRVFSLYQHYGLPLTVPYVVTSTQAVQVLTAHRAKGLEFGIVFVPNLSDTRWGGQRGRDAFKIPYSRLQRPDDVVDDDRRLLYVAMTRAKQRLYLSYSAVSASGKEQTASRLLAPVLEAGHVVDERQEDTTDETFAGTTSLAGDVRPPAITKEVLCALVQQTGLSPTAFNNYRTSPWNYLYRSLLRVPELPKPHMQYGTAIHSVLEYLVKQHTRQATGTVTDINRQLRIILDQFLMTDEEVVQYHKQGLAALDSYHEHVMSQLKGASRSDTELSLSAHMVTGIPALAELRLVGKLDRVDYAADGSIIRVVDYKTGKPASRNHILGTTKGSSGDYYTQLCFYALLLRLEGRHHDEIAYTISFVEPTASGRIKEEAFTIHAEEIDALEQELVRFVEEISSGTCLSAPCDPQVCEYCDLVAQLRRDETVHTTTQPS